MFNPENLQEEFNISKEEFIAILKLCKFSANKKTFSQTDKELFAQMKHALNQPNVPSFEQEVTILNDTVEQQIKDPVLSNSQLLEQLEILQKKAIETGFNIGIQQAELMGQVIPQVTIKRLREMIANGELKQNFEQIWQESAKKLGNGQYLQQQIEQQWQEYQLNKYQPRVNLLESSTPSSTNDS